MWISFYFKNKKNKNTKPAAELLNGDLKLLVIKVNNFSNRFY